MRLGRSKNAKNRRCEHSGELARLGRTFAELRGGVREGTSPPAGVRGPPRSSAAQRDFFLRAFAFLKEKLRIRRIRRIRRILRIRIPPLPL